MISGYARMLVAVLLAAAGLSACGDITERSCSIRPCPSELVVEVRGPQDVAYTVYVSASGVETHTQSCSSLEPICTVYLRDFGPEEVSVRVTWAEQEAEAQFTPAYETVHPNGPDCPPACRTATVVMVVEQ